MYGSNSGKPTGALRAISRIDIRAAVTIQLGLRPDSSRNCADPVPGLLVRASLEGVVLAVRFAFKSIFKPFDNIVLTRNVIGVWCEINCDVSGSAF